MFKDLAKLETVFPRLRIERYWDDDHDEGAWYEVCVECPRDFHAIGAGGTLDLALHDAMNSTTFCTAATRLRERK